MGRVGTTADGGLVALPEVTLSAVRADGTNFSVVGIGRNHQSPPTRAETPATPATPAKPRAITVGSRVTRVVGRVL